MKAAELREMTLEELRKLEQDTREKLFRLRVRNRLGQLDSPMEIRKTRKDLARILTVIREKERMQAGSDQSQRSA